MQFIKGGFSYRANKELGSNMGIWQKGFSDHRICDAEIICGMSITSGEIRFASVFANVPANIRIHPQQQSVNWTRYLRG